MQSKSKHEPTKKGVRFTVDSVSLGALLKEQKYSVDSFLSNYYEEHLFPITIEVSSLNRGSPSVSYNESGFMEVALEAFNSHYPLVIRPDDIWLVLTTGFASHVDKNAEKLRKNFVSHEGKKFLGVNADHFVMGKMAPESWESDIFPQFSSKILEYIGKDTHSLMATPYSTSTVTDIAAHEITLMSAMKNYFDYGMMTMCGIPWIELQGTLGDWKSIHQRAEKLCTLMVPEDGKRWWTVLGPVLQEFIHSYEGNVNIDFWKGICKRIPHGQGSGSYETISGWVTILYHNLAQHHKPWQQMNSEDGPEPGSFGSLVSSAPVTWNYFGEIYNLHFHAGYFGMTQDSETRAVMPRIGWVVTHDPPKDREKRLIELKKLLSDLTAGNNDKSAGWRIRSIEKEIKNLSDAK